MENERVGQENIIPRNRLNRYKYRGRNFGLTPYETIKLIAHYEEKYRRLKELLNEKDAIIKAYNNNVKLPKEVAQWLVEKNFTSVMELETDIIRLVWIDIPNEEEEHIYNYILNNDEVITNIIDAYRYGWEVE